MTVISLHGELRALRESICSTCKRKFVLVPSQVASAEAAADSPSIVNQIPRPQIPAKRKISEASCAESDRIPSGSRPPTIASAMYRSTITDIPQSVPSMLPQPIPILSTPTDMPSPPPVLTTMPGNENAATITSSTPITVPRVPRWSVRRDSTAEAALDVTFVRSFDYKDRVPSVRFSADGRYLAAALADAEWENGRIIICDVETGEKTRSVSI
jgi:hypothetical protein